MRPARALGHPAWLVALAVLAVNDHILKTAWPGALTGKLSDLAGLIVAPVVLATLARVRTDRGLVAAWLATGAGFAAIKTWPAASALFERALAGQNVVDPTDLIALIALPLGLALLRPTMRRALAPGRAHRLALAAGAVACVATPAPPPRACPPGSFPELEPCAAAFPAVLAAGNLTSMTETVLVQTPRPDPGLTCDAIRNTPCVLRGALGPARTVRLRPTEHFAIGARLDGCAVAVVTLDDWRPPVLVIRYPGEPTRVPFTSTRPVPATVYVGPDQVGAAEGDRADGLLTLPLLCEAAP